MLDKAEVSWTILMLGGGHFAGAVFKGNQVGCSSHFCIWFRVGRAPNLGSIMAESF